MSRLELPRNEDGPGDASQTVPVMTDEAQARHLAEYKAQLVAARARKDADWVALGLPLPRPVANDVEVLAAHSARGVLSGPPDATWDAEKALTVADHAVAYLREASDDDLAAGAHDECARPYGTDQHCTICWPPRSWDTVRLVLARDLMDEVRDLREARATEPTN